MAQEYNHLLEVEAVMGKYSREIRKHITGQQTAVPLNRAENAGRAGTDAIQSLNDIAQCTGIFLFLLRPAQELLQFP